MTLDPRVLSSSPTKTKKPNTPSCLLPQQWDILVSLLLELLRYFSTSLPTGVCDKGHLPREALLSLFTLCFVFLIELNASWHSLFYPIELSLSFTGMWIHEKRMLFVHCCTHPLPCLTWCPTGTRHFWLLSKYIISNSQKYFMQLDSLMFILWKYFPFSLSKSSDSVWL